MSEGAVVGSGPDSSTTGSVRECLRGEGFLGVLTDCGDSFLTLAGDCFDGCDDLEAFLLLVVAA